MDPDRWTSRWQPSGETGSIGRGADRAQPDNRDDPYRSNAPSRHASSDADNRWKRQGAGQQWDSRAGGRPSDERATGDHAFQRREPPRHQQPRYQSQRDAPASTAANWVGRGKHEGVYDLETDLMCDAFGGLDPGESETGTPSSAGASCHQEDDPWSDNLVSGGGGGSSLRPPAWAAVTSLTLAQLEEAVSGSETHIWSLERLAEAATALCQLRSTGSTAALESSPAISPFNRREEAVMDAIATAAVCGTHRGGTTSPGTHASSSQHGWAVAQLLWVCARGQYWAGPPTPRPGTYMASAAGAGDAAAAADTVYGNGKAANGDGVNARAGLNTWPSPTELRSTAAESLPLCALSLGPQRQDDGAVDSSGNGSAATVPHDGGASAERATTNGGGRVSGDGSVGRFRPLGVELLGWLAADGCRLVGQLDSRSLSLVWWALAKATALARAKHGATHLSPAAAAAAAAAADVLAAASPPLVAALDARAAEGLPSKNNAELCALLYSCACVNKSCERLLRALGDELEARLERAIILGDAGMVAGSPRGHFSSRELSCIAYSCGLLGLRHEQLMAALSEYAASGPHTKWSASAISVFMYGIANVGHRDQRLMSWADAAISAKPAVDFNLRNISFLLYNFHRLRWWPRRAAEHLLCATRLHAPPSIPLISISTILMCMGSGRARDERSLAHLCQALSRRPAAQLSCKDVCICLTALQRLHGENVLASQQPEVLAALHHLATAIAERGFSRVAPACRAVPVFNHQEVSNAIFALGKLKYYSPAVLEALRDHAARGGLEGASAWDCTAILVGLAHLNYGGHDGEGGRAAAGGGGGGGAARRAGAAVAGRGPDVDLLELLAATVARRARTAKSQDLANSLWSLTVLEGALERYRSIVTTLLEEVNRRGPANKSPEGFNVDEQRQLWQVHRELAALPQPYASLREDLVQLGKLGMSEADHTYSRVQASFQSLLTAMRTSGRFPKLRDLLFEQELVPGGEQLMRIDVQAIVERTCYDGNTSSHTVAIEFDGPFHFMVNEPYTARIDGRTALRNRILARHLGRENLICVSMAEWVAASREPATGLPGRWRLMAAKMGV